MKKEGSDVRYLKEISKRINNERTTSLTRKNSRTCCGEKGHANEKYFWIPKESFEVAHKFKESLQGQILNNELIESLLFEVLVLVFILKVIFAKLNKIWVAKETKMKTSYEKEISKVKRHYSSMISSGDVQSKKTISRLQSQLKLLKENKENVGESKNLFYPCDESKKHQSSNEFEGIKNLEIKKLKNRIDELENEKNENKTVYIEGSYWMRMIIIIILVKFS